MRAHRAEWRAATRVDLAPTFDEVFGRLGRRTEGRRLFVVVDSRVIGRNPRCLRALPARARREALHIRGGEACKSLGHLERLYRAARERGIDRSAVVVAVGGGTVGDLVGFFAATWMRGLEWIVVATTSLAIADSALGGKTAVDWGGLKNPVGAFHPPRAIHGVLEALQTLPPRHLRAGMAEVVKAAVIGDRALYRRLERIGARLCADPAAAEWSQVLKAAARVKGRIVQTDPLEEGIRALLNFGHTYGHALEVSHRPRLLHGEAVSLGMLAAVEISERQSQCPRGFREELARLLLHLRLPVQVRNLDEAAFWSALLRDKKVRGGRPRLVLTQGVGSASFGHAVAKTQLKAVLRSLGPGG